MPPLKKVSKEDIVKITLEILKKEPADHLNARRIAHELNCSVQPIYFNFKNMEELKEEAFQSIYEIYKDYIIKGSKKKNAYKEMGLAYIKFAQDYPNYFKLLFMNSSNLSSEQFMDHDDMKNNIIQEGMKVTGFSKEEQKQFHLKVWIFTHGLATLVATSTVCLKEEEINHLLQQTVREMILGRREKKNETNDKC